MWIDLERDIFDTFDVLSSCVDVAELGCGFRRHEYLTTTRATTRERSTPEQRRAKRADLERNRRAYKTAKQREYNARKKAA